MSNSARMNVWATPSYLFWLDGMKDKLKQDEIEGAFFKTELREVMINEERTQCKGSDT